MKTIQWGKLVVWLSSSYLKSFWRISCFFHKGQCSESLVIKHPARLLLYSNCSYRTTDTGYSAGETWSFPALATKKYGKAVWVSAHEGCLSRHCWSPNIPVSKMLATSPLAQTTNSVWPSFSPVPKLAKPALQLESLLARFQHLSLTYDCLNIHGAQRAVLGCTLDHDMISYNMNFIHKCSGHWLKFYKVCCFVFLSLGCL